MSKSSVQFSPNTSTTTTNTVTSALAIPKTNNLEKYLGCPIINGRVNKDTFADVILKAKQQLSKWKASSLSVEGRKVLIKSNLSALPIFLMQAFMLPSSILHELDKTYLQFFWNKQDRYTPLISWDKICSDTLSGGLGI